MHIRTQRLRGFSLLAFAVLLHVPLHAQLRGQQGFWQPDSTPNRARLRAVTYGSLGVMAGVYTYLGTAWYSDQARTQFRWFNDGGQWLQIDKVGHAYGAYQESRLLQSLLVWAGAPKGKVLLWGSLGGFILQAPIEFFDGFAEDFGASGYDILANAAGAGLAALNYGLWQDHRLQLKFSYYPTDYPDLRPDLLGNGADELLKDYNGQTYWLAVSVDAFLPPGPLKDRWPDWLGLAIGYGGEGMIGGYGQDPLEVIRQRETRQWYLGLDVDLTRIRTRSGLLRTVFGVANAVRLPLPALRLSGGKLVFMPLAF